MQNQTVLQANRKKKVQTVQFSNYRISIFLDETDADEAKVLEQVIRDTEQISLEEEAEEEAGKEGELGEGEGEKGLVIEPGSAAAILEEFIGRFVVLSGSCNCHMTVM